MNNRLKGPRFVRYFNLVLEALQNLGGSGQPDEVKNYIANKLSLSEVELNEQISSGASRFSNAVDWARFYLAKAGLIDSSKRGVWSLTEKGRNTSLNQEQSLDIFNEVHKYFVIEQKKKKAKKEEHAESEITETPESIFPIQLDHRSTLMSIIQDLPPEGFERLCQRLLRESGFEQVTITGKSGDGGLDGIGILQMTPFVSFKVLFQCKRYSGTISSSQVRDFRGAMMGRTDKGIIMTTGIFTSNAKKEANREGVPPIELVDGEKLVDMFENLELGLIPKKAFDIDTSFFNEFRH